MKIISSIILILLIVLMGYGAFAHVENQKEDTEKRQKAEIVQWIENDLKEINSTLKNLESEFPDWSFQKNIQLNPGLWTALQQVRICILNYTHHKEFYELVINETYPEDKTVNNLLYRINETLGIDS